MNNLPEITKETKIGWIGTGVMGASMFGHIIKAGYPGYVFTRTKSKAQRLMESGATWLENPLLVAENSDIIFTMVGFPKDVEEVYFGEKGIISGVKQGGILIDMTTNSPSMAADIQRAARNRSAFSLDAPVSGGDVGARNATLSIMVGGDEKVFLACKPLLELMGDKICYQGKAGSGQHTKMSNQIVVASSMIGVCESLLYGCKAGLDPQKMLQSISKGAAACWTLDNLAPRILKRDFEPGFFVEHFIKDMGIILDEAKRMNIVLPGLALVHQLYVSVLAKGYGKKGTQALMLALEDLSGLKRKS
ncbi:MAG: NAD(P)-dependent oxidoreductase [Bacteroidales bacterium]|nr:MAG: NAD(P)-dependent oxidoreductase [Bacteroidales bacterium]